MKNIVQKNQLAYFKILFFIKYVKQVYKQRVNLSIQAVYTVIQTIHIIIYTYML